MRDLLSTMFRLPLEMAQLSADELQRMIEPDLNTDGRKSQEPQRNAERHQRFTRSSQSTQDVLSSMIRIGERMMRGIANAVQRNAPDFDNANTHGPNDFMTPYAGAEAATSTQPTSHQSPYAPATQASFRNSLSPADFGRVDVSNMVVIGDSLAAGVGDFALSSDFQRMSFPAQLARHLGIEFEQPLFQPPGVECAIGGNSSSIRFPDWAQTRVFENLPPSDFGNLSIPGLRVRDALRLRPNAPLVQPDDLQQTLTNLIIGSQFFAAENESPDTPLDCAIGRRPTFVILAIGFDELLEAAVGGKPESLPVMDEMQRDYSTILCGIAKADCNVLVLNVPDPLNTASFSSLRSAARTLKVRPSSLTKHFNLREGDYITVAGLLEIGTQINPRCVQPLNGQHVLPQLVAATISTYVSSLNEMIAGEVNRHKQAELCSVAEYYRKFDERGESVGSQHLTADFLGGFFSLNGHSLGHTAHALLANQVVWAINDSFDASIPPIDPELVVSSDPIASYRTASGREWSEKALDAMRPAHASNQPTDISRIVVSKRSGHQRSQRLSHDALDEGYNSKYRNAPNTPLKIPVELEQVLPICGSTSFYGDAIAVSNCHDLRSGEFGKCANRYFGGLTMFAASLRGELRIKFTPYDDHLTHFEVHLDADLLTDDGELVAPLLYKLPVQNGRIGKWSGPVCSGILDLVSGDLTNVETSFRFANSALGVLATLNPQLQDQPVRFPGEYGSAFIRFLPRDDGKLDFAFHGTTFIPLGSRGRFPLPFESQTSEFASIPANDTQLHPFLYLSTCESEDGGNGRQIEPWIPTNCAHVFTADISRTSFGDGFTLNHPDLGFAEGRSHLAGRMKLQFGERFGDLVPFAARMLPPSGSLDSRSLSPLQDVFPGKLVSGMVGHDAVLRFAARQYRQNDLYLIDDPFDVALGAVNVYTGEVIGDFLHRAFLGQALFFALVRVEPRTPQGSFEYRGPAVFERGPNGQIHYRFNGTVFLPYQEGFLWPLPDLANGVPIGPNSRLDPFFQVEAIHDPNPWRARKAGSARMQLAPTGDRFSYRYSVSSESSEQSAFEYTNHTQEGTFVMQSLASVDFSKPGRGDGCLVTFAGFGHWSRDKSNKLRLATVQVSTAHDRPYVSILIDGGRVSNVNTKPRSELPPLSQRNDADT